MMETWQERFNAIDKAITKNESLTHSDCVFLCDLIKRLAAENILQRHWEQCGHAEADRKIINRRKPE